MSRFPAVLAALASCAAIAAPCLAGPAPDAPGLAHPERWPEARSRGLVDPDTEAFVSGLLARMSLEEKVGQMIQADAASVSPQDLREVPLGSILAGGNTPALGTGALRTPASSWVATSRAFRDVSLEARPGHVPVPILLGVDAVHGNSHVAGATVFPHNVGLGAAGDPDLVRRIAEATAQETIACGFDWDFGPTLAVPQDPRWGRTYEGFSQDPALVVRYAAAAVTGLQGPPGAEHLGQSGHVAASAKHFLGDGGTREGVDQGDAAIPEEELVRLHAPGYPAAIEAGALTVMVSFSSWQGVKMSANQSLLTGVLKERWNFDGFVVSDWNSHGQVPGCSNEDCPAAINAGIDMLMAPADWRALYRNLLAQARSGIVPAARIDDAVRRILRVKARLGLFDIGRPWEGRTGVLASPAHRALAREAVRKSLVLLKNNGDVLPIRGSARVLVTGPGADSIGMQSGGWTLSWQGNDNRNGDFPQGESILSGLRSALEAGGGSVETSADGTYSRRPDAAVLVYGEAPYAEGWGDRKDLAFRSGARELATLRRLRAEGIPTISVFLSGRPLWVNPQLNASDAFVVAWLPGTEGGGIADVLVGDPGGAARRDFSGRLSYDWPATAAGNGRASPPLFPLGSGLRYTDHRDLAALPEDPGVPEADSNFASYLAQGRSVPPWHLLLRQGDDTVELAPGATGAGLDGVLSSRPTDSEDRQEGARSFTWTGKAPASVSIAGPTLDLRMLSNGEASLEMRYRLDEAPGGRVELAQACGPGCTAALDLGPTLRAAPPGAWRSLKVRLSCFREAGANLQRVDTPFSILSRGSLRLTLGEVRLTADPAGAACLPHQK